MMLIYIKQNLSNIWRSIHEKVTLRLSWNKALVMYKKRLMKIVKILKLNW